MISKSTPASVMLTEGHKKSPANHVVWINLIRDNTTHFAHFGRRKTQETYSHTLTARETIPGLSTIPSQHQNVIQVVTFWLVNLDFWRGWWSWKNSIQEMRLACLQFNFLRATFWSIFSRGLKHSKGIYQKQSQNVIHVFCEKAIWRVKWQCWKDFSGMFLKEIESFFADIILRDQSNTSHAVSHLEFFFQKLQRVTFGLLNHCLCGKNGQKIFFVKILLTAFKLNN